MSFQNESDKENEAVGGAAPPNSPHSRTGSSPLRTQGFPYDPDTFEPITDEDEDESEGTISVKGELGEEVEDPFDDPDEDTEIQQTQVPADLNKITDQIVSDEYDMVQDEHSIKSKTIADVLAATLNKWLRNCPMKNETKSLFQQCLIPDNVERLNPVRINELLYPRLNFRAKEMDKKLKSFNTFFTRSLGPLVTLLDYLIKIEAQHK